MGAIANMAPADYAGIVIGVPFVDVVTTMLDESIPLTTNEFDEWGNPKEKKFYDYMLSYSPYDQLGAHDYPAMFVHSGLWDSQVQYFEPTKYVARLRARRTGDSLVVLRTNMEAGHGGKSGRYEHYREYAEQYAFILDQAGVQAVVGRVVTPLRRSGSSCAGTPARAHGPRCSSVRDELEPVARPRQRDFVQVADVRRRPVGHHHDAVRQQHGLVHVVRDHQHGVAELGMNLHHLFLQVRARSASSAPKGSSSSSTLGLIASARAMPTRCFMPPEISPGRFFIACVMCTSSRLRSVHSCRSADGLAAARTPCPRRAARCRTP